MDLVVVGSWCQVVASCVGMVRAITTKATFSSSLHTPTCWYMYVRPQKPRPGDLGNIPKTRSLRNVMLSNPALNLSTMDTLLYIFTMGTNADHKLEHSSHGGGQEHVSGETAKTLYNVGEGQEVGAMDCQSCLEHNYILAREGHGRPG